MRMGQNTPKLAKWSATLRTSLGAIVLASLAACGGGDASAPAGTAFSGALMDGYIQGATVCLDLDANGTCDLTKEPGTTTTAGGRFSFQASSIANLAAAASYHLVAEIPATAIDDDTPGVQVGTAYKLLAPASLGGSVVSPLTTAVSAVMKEGQTLDQAKAQAKTNLSLPTDFDLSKDYIATATKDVGAHNVAKIVAKKLATSGAGTDVAKLKTALTSMTDAARTAFASTTPYTADQVATAAGGGGSTGSSCGTTAPTCAPTTTIPSGSTVIYSDATSVAGIDTAPPWGQNPPVVATEETIASNKSLKYVFGALYQGIEWTTPQNVSTKGKLHLDFFSSNITSVKVSIISAGPRENAYTQAVTAGSWNSVDIDLSNYTVPDKAAITQIKLEPNVAGTLYVDNIYFWGTGGAVAPTNLLTNGDFSSGATGWSGNAVNVLTDSGNSYNFANVTAAGNPWDVNISNVVNIPTSGVRYLLRFRASSDRARTLIAGIGLNQDPWTNVTQTVNLTATSQTFELKFTSNFASPTSRVIFDMGAAVGQVVIDDVVLSLDTSSTSGGGGASSSPLTFSSGFASNVLTSSGGKIASAGGSNLDDWNCNGTPAWCGSGAAGAGADSSMYFYYQTPSAAAGLYSQVEVFAPNVSGFSTTGDTAGITLGSQTKINFTFNPNPEWFRSTNNKFAVVITLGKRYAIGAGCQLQLHGVMTPTSEGATAYSMNLRNNFRVAADCATGIAPTDVAAALAASPVVSAVKFMGAGGGAAIIGRNDVASGANFSVLAGAVYPTTVALKGAITFD